MLPFDSALLFIPVVAVFSVWMIYEHRRTTTLSGVAKKVLDANAADINTHLDKLDTDLDSHEAFLKSELIGVQQMATALQTLAETHRHPDLAPWTHDHVDLSPVAHDHTGGMQGHVHWLKYSSTELTDAQRRDVYVCLVPDCKGIFAHSPAV